MYKDLTDKVYDSLKQMITSGELRPGQKLIQENLASMLGVSRTPILQAISRLSRDKLVVSIPRRGAYVRSYSAKMILNIFDVRCALEPLTASLAAAAMTDEVLSELDGYMSEMKAAVDAGDIDAYASADCMFHMRIAQASDNQYIYDMMKSFTNIMFSKELLLKSLSDSYHEHETLMSNFRNHDAYGARTAMIYHLNEGARDRFAALLAEEADKNGTN